MGEVTPPTLTPVIAAAPPATEDELAPEADSLESAPIPDALPPIVVEPEAPQPEAPEEPSEPVEPQP